MYINICSKQYLYINIYEGIRTLYFHEHANFSTHLMSLHPSIDLDDTIPSSLCFILDTGEIILRHNIYIEIEKLHCPNVAVDHYFFYIFIL